MAQERDLRVWIEQLEEAGELKRITAEVDWRGELAAIQRKVLTDQGPALLFENIKDYNKGNVISRRLFTGGLGNKARVAMMFNKPKDTPRSELVQLYLNAIRNPMKPIIVDKSEAAVKQNILSGDDIDLYKIPVPKWHYLDNGRYINTWSGVVTMDPDTGVHNVGMYRGAIKSKDQIGVLLLTAQHWGHHFTKYAQRKQPMPVAVVYGYDPTLGFTAGSEQPTGCDEYHVMGAIRQDPVRLVKCETSDLLVPANAEIVVEGFIHPQPEHHVQEGPFGEYTGYYGGSERKRYAIKVERITHRDDPIYRGNLEGAGPGQPNEDSHIYAISSKAIMFEILERAGIPGIIDVRPGPVSYVKIRQSYKGQAKQIAAALWGSWASEWTYKVLVVVDHDIDIYNERHMQWAICYRCDPGKGDIVIFPETRGSCLDPSMTEAEKNDMLYGTGTWNRTLIDATRSLDTAVRDEWGNLSWMPLSMELHPDDEKLVQERWEEYGI